MTGIVTVINTFVAKGAGAVITTSTLHRWGISFAAAFPTLLLIAPLAARLTDRIIKSD
jgi:hypothetical protein